MNLPYSWRITKYDPALRNSLGHFLADDWTAYSDIGKSYDGKLLTYGDYFARESDYAKAVLAFLGEAGLVSLGITELENRALHLASADKLRDIALPPSRLKKGMVIDESELADVVRLNLREVLWCKLATKNRFHLHFGYDYYMYIGSNAPSLAATDSAQRAGLFVEEMVSPYL